MRSLRSLTINLPNPAISKVSPADSVSIIFSKTQDIILSISFFEMVSNCSLTS